MIVINDVDLVSKIVDCTDKLNSIPFSDEVTKLLSRFDIESGQRKDVKHFAIDDVLPIGLTNNEIFERLNNASIAIQNTLVHEIKQSLIDANVTHELFSSQEKLGKIIVCPALTFSHVNTECNTFKMYAFMRHDIESDKTVISCEVNFSVKIEKGENNEKSRRHI